MTPESQQIRTADVNEERQALDITWRDGHASAYPLKYLRSECPCANCRTERDQARSNPFHIVSGGAGPLGAQLMGVEAVGRYGMRIAWGDGHDAGIYTFEYLREICPCE